MRALGRVSESAARVAPATPSRHLQIVPGAAEVSDFVDGSQDVGGSPGVGGSRGVGGSQNVVSLASARARRAGHPAGSARDR